MKTKSPIKGWIKRSLGMVSCLLFGVAAYSATIIDHNCTDITAIPEAAITQAKNNLHIAYGHTSHGSQLTDGMSALVTFMNGKGYSNNLYAWSHNGSPGALDLHDYAMGGDVGYYPDWVNNTHSYLGAVDGNGRGSINPDVNVIIWSWCGQAAGYTEQQMIDRYLTPMTTLEATYPGIKFVYMTCHLNGTGAAGNLNLRNEQIRTFCQANNKILYDFADIESYGPDGATNYMPLLCTDNCDYDSNNDGSTDTNWATAWQNSHTENVDWFACNCAHSQSLNGNRKAYAAWWLWAVLGGWEPSETAPAAPTNLALTPNSLEKSVSLSWTDNSDTETSFVIQRQFNGGAWNDAYATRGSNVVTYSDTSLSAGTYKYRVIARNGYGDSAATTVKEGIIFPETRTADPAVNKILNARQKTTAFMTDGLSEQMVSDLLWATCGINRPVGTNGPYRTSNFSFRSRDTQVYLAAANGVFLYDPIEHALVKKSNSDLRSTLNPAYSTAPLTIIYVSEYTRAYAPIHAGFCAENVTLYCADKNLGTVTLEGISADITGLNLTASFKGYLIQTVGYKEGSTVTDPAWSPAEQPLIAADVNQAPSLKILKERRSITSITPAVFTDQVLSELLWSGLGINATGERTSPIVGGTNDIDLYVLLPSGTYVYRPATHALHQLDALDRRTTPYNFGANVQAVFIYVSDYSKLSGLSDQAAYARLHAGFVAQNVSAYCASEKIAQVIRSSGASNIAPYLQLTANQNAIFTQTLAWASAMGASTVTLAAGPNGSVAGTLSQSIAYRGNGTAVTAVPNTDYAFSYWSGLPGGRVKTNPLNLTNVVCPMNLAAHFVVNDTHAPLAPAGLESSNVASSTLTLAWQASSDLIGVTGYRIYRNGAQIGTSVTTSFNDSGLTLGTPYTYKVAAFDAAGNLSEQSAGLTVTPVNQVCVVSSIPGITKSEGETIQFNITVSDGNAGDSITLTPSELPGSATLEKTGDRTWQFTWLTDFSSAGEYSIVFTGYDGCQYSEPVTAVISVTHVSTNLNLTNKPDWVTTE